MAYQNDTTPNTLLVSAISEIIAPITAVFAGALISLVNRLSRRANEEVLRPGVVPAPHVALVMVPGQFVTEPFLRR